MTKIFYSILFLCVLTINAKSQWYYDLQHNDNIVFDISACDTGVVWMVGSNTFPPDTPMVYIRTSYQGWGPVSVSGLPVNSYYNCIFAVDSVTAWIGTVNGKIYFTSNTGDNWTLKIDAGQNSYVNDIKFSRINKQYGYIFCDPPDGPGKPFKIFKTANGGINWTEYNPVFGNNYFGTYKATCITDSNHVWYGLNCQAANCGVPKIAYTSNGGLNWSLQNLNYPDNAVLSVNIRCDNVTGFSSAYDSLSRIFKSSNGGLSWNLLNEYTEPIFDINCIDSSLYCYYMNEHYFFKTTNDGGNWIQMQSPNIFDQPQAFDVVKQGNKLYLWACTVNSNVLRCIDSINYIGIKNINEEIPKSFFLEQNYPNPFNPVTSIKFALPKASMVKLVIYDLLGKEVAALVNEMRQPGIYNEMFDASNLASGVYFYKIDVRQAGSSTGDFTDVKKMVLIK
jgi:photosystem II stability/assembly factor-like uncharacterized protein